MMNLAPILIGFIFSINQNPMTDARTSIASMGSEQSQGVDIMCGDMTGGKPMVVIYAGRYLAYSRVTMGNSYSVKVRFDDEPAMTFRADYNGKRAIFDGAKDNLIRRIEAAQTVTVELDALDWSQFYFTFKPGNSSVPINRVLNECGK